MHPLSQAFQRADWNFGFSNELADLERDNWSMIETQIWPTRWLKLSGPEWVAAALFLVHFPLDHPTMPEQIEQIFKEGKGLLRAQL